MEFRKTAKVHQAFFRSRKGTPIRSKINDPSHVGHAFDGRLVGKKITAMTMSSRCRRRIARLCIGAVDAALGADRCDLLPGQRNPIDLVRLGDLHRRRERPTRRQRSQF
jgi:hypothetical protein